MKIAAITDDGETISRHFGRAVYYLVATIEDGKITGRQLRDKPGRSQFVARLHEVGHSGRRHGADAEHLQWAESINDCEALLCGNIDVSVYESMKAQGILPIVTDIAEIDEAALAYARGEITDYVENAH